MLALALLAAATRPADPTRAARNRTPIDLTVPEIRRLIGTLFAVFTDPHHAAALVHLAQAPPGRRQTQPLPATAHHRDHHAITKCGWGN